MLIGAFKFFNANCLQDELAAQRRKDEKLENQRKRVAAQEEEKRQEHLRQEAEKQREKERLHLAHQVDAHKTAQRQALNNKRMEVERAKLERPPPPPLRQHPGGGVDTNMAGEKPLPPAPVQRSELGHNRPPQRMPSTVYRSQEDLGRSMNSTMQNSTKAPPKRPLPQDMNDDYSRPPVPRNGPSYTQNAEKRRRTGEDQNGDLEVLQRAPMAPPIRQSTVRQPKVCISYVKYG
jgi:flagellar biosynthesis GTPase FlhF